MSASVKAILKANVEQLMRLHFGCLNTSRLGRETEIKQGGAMRMLDEVTDVQIGTIEKVAARFEIDAWQLLAPELGAGLYRLDGQRLNPAFVPPPAPQAVPPRFVHRDTPPAADGFVGGNSGLGGLDEIPPLQKKKKGRG